jgi:hypothetical protein
VKGNATSDNSKDGILADTDAASGSVTNNHAVTNVLYDYQNSGTGNTWTVNTCSPLHVSAFPPAPPDAGR